MPFEIITSIRNLWIGIYWENWENKTRTDLWISIIPFVSIHLWW